MTVWGTFDKLNGAADAGAEEKDEGLCIREQLMLNDGWSAKRCPLFCLLPRSDTSAERNFIYRLPAVCGYAELSCLLDYLTNNIPILAP